MSEEENPRLRPILFMKTKMEGKDYILAQDRTRQAQPVLLPSALEPILRLLDGNHSLRDIQMELTRAQGGQLVSFDEVKNIVEQLDSHMLLDSERFRETQELERRFWEGCRLRKPFHSGQAYPDDPDELMKMLDGFYSGLDSDPVIREGEFVRGLLAPHIDIRSGGPTFARAYRELSGEPRAGLYVILGTAHDYTPGPVSISPKDYLTPLGVARTDNDFIDRLACKYNPDWLMDDTSHKTEHSIEFQLIFLQHLLGSGDMPPVVPVLAGGFSEYVEGGSSPADDERVARFIEAFKETAEEDGRKITYIVGGDLAHIGPRYGDSHKVLPDDIKTCSEKDMQMLEKACEGAEEFFECVAGEGDRRNICGMPPLYLMLKLIDGAKGEIISNSHWFDESTGSAVTFAAMVYK